VHHNGKFFPDLMCHKALDFTQKASKPFLIYYAMNLPHYPYQAPEKWIDHYKDMQMPRKLYAAAVSAIDESIAELFDGLKKQGKFDNTIIVFMSDHGHSTEVRAFGGGGSAGPFRGAKFSLYEGGLRVPGIIYYPPVVPGNITRDQTCSSLDWLPTLLDICQIKHDPSAFTGKTILPVLTDNEPSPHKHLIWKSGKQKAIRRGDWKLLENAIDTTKGANNYAKVHHGLALYNLKSDPGETTDVSKKHPKIVEQLKNFLPSR
ncbi:MAG: sulfatase family protein, partial [Akkermansiaceae bacterium]